MRGPSWGGAPKHEHASALPRDRLLTAIEGRHQKLTTLGVLVCECTPRAAVDTNECNPSGALIYIETGGGGGDEARSVVPEERRPNGRGGVNVCTHTNHGSAHTPIMDRHTYQTRTTDTAMYVPAYRRAPRKKLVLVVLLS